MTRRTVSSYACRVVGAVIVAVNGAPTTRQAYEETVRRVKGAGRPVTLGFRRLHAVSDPGMRHRRYWQGYLFAREPGAGHWTGRFYVLREDGALRSYPGMDIFEHAPIEVLAVGGWPALHDSAEVARAAAAAGDRGDDGKGSLGELAFAVPLRTADRFLFFKAPSAERKCDWVCACLLYTSPSPRD